MASSIAILMCTYNGERFLHEQLASLESQTDEDWVLWASDDGSTDATLDILSESQNRLGKEKIKILRGPGLGFAANFMALAMRKEINAEYFAFSDQDDIWKPQKLERSRSFLSDIGNEFAALYCSRTDLIDVSGNVFGKSPYFTGEKNFRNALVQSLAGGNTMVFNKKLRDLFVALSKKNPKIVSHDWTMYQLASGTGGKIFYDEWGSVGYRQHKNNLIGMNRGPRAHLVRSAQFIGGRYRRWNDENLAALKLFDRELSRATKEDISEFEKLRSGPSFQSLKNIAYPKFQRQSALETFALSCGFFLGLV